MYTKHFFLYLVNSTLNNRKYMPSPHIVKGTPPFKSYFLDVHSLHGRACVLENKGAFDDAVRGEEGLDDHSANPDKSIPCLDAPAECCNSMSHIRFKRKKIHFPEVTKGDIVCHSN